MFQRCVETTLDISGRFRSHKNNSRLTVSAGRILPKLDGFGSQQKIKKKTDMLKQYWLVVSTPLKNISQIGSFPQVGMKIKKN